MRILLICFITIIFSFCSKQEKNKEIKYPYIPEHKFIKLLIDYHLAQGVRSTSFYRHKMQYEEKIDVTDSVIKSYGYTRAMFDSTISFYSVNPERFDELYYKVITDLSRMEAKVQELLAKKQAKSSSSTIASQTQAYSERDKLSKNFEKPVSPKMEKFKEQITTPIVPYLPLEIVKQAKYTAPVVVDTYKKEKEVTDIIISDVVNVYNETPPGEINMEEKKDEIFQEEDHVFTIVEEPATFQGGDINTFRIWVQKKMIYPPTAAEAGISGKVFVQFCVNSKGIVTDAKVLRGVIKELDKEAVRCIMNSPRWVPGKQGGKPVNQMFVLPIIFKLHSDAVQIFNVPPVEGVNIEEKKNEPVKKDEPAYNIVEEPASFQGGDINTFRIWVQKRMVYPSAAAAAGISGKVFVQFCVNANGIVTDAKVLRGVNKELDKEAIRCIMDSPVWVPAKKDTKPVKQEFVIPIIFKLQ